MDYSYYSNPQSQQYPPFYGFNGAAAPDQNNQISSPDDIQETLATLVRPIDSCLMERLSRQNDDEMSADYFTELSNL